MVDGGAGVQWAGSRHVDGQVTDYLEDALPASGRVAFEAHVAGCPACAQLLHEIRETIRALGELPPEPLGADARDRLLQTFRRWRDGRP